MKKTDLLLVAGALIIAGGIWFFYSAGAEKGKGVEITVGGESKASFESHKDAAPAATAPAPKQTAPSDGFYPIDESIEDDDLPF